MRALPREEDMLPRIAAAVATIEHDHFVAVDVRFHQFVHGDVAHVQRALAALEYQGLADGVVLAHGADAGSKLVLEIGCGRDEVGEHEVAPMKMDQPGSWGDGLAWGDNEEGRRVARLLGLGQRQAQQRGCVGIEDEDAHIGLAGQFKDVRQVVWHALVPVLLPKLLDGDALGVLQVLVRPGRGDQFDADRRAVRHTEGDEQHGLRRGDVRQVGEVVPGIDRDVLTADLPAPAVVAGLESQALHHFPRSLGRIAVTDVDRATVKVVAMNGIDHGADHTFAADTFTGIAFGQYLGAHAFGAIADHGEIVGDDAGR
ncbi:hypothetical protein XF_1769 [Xylella fastidiosa 9a5c]|uniref:Uncharacterized protein n=1 Tax=Xylella fastidiosa (strain 9a5c) TaxID=160492 RepID=Q9PCK9_XYLFA|nr:hypothetical protein XF_1769 [Xylella fastidiosa 9a5c]